MVVGHVAHHRTQRHHAAQGHRARRRRAEREAHRRALAALGRRAPRADRRLHVEQHDVRIAHHVAQRLQQLGGFVGCPKRLHPGMRRAGPLALEVGAERDVAPRAHADGFLQRADAQGVVAGGGACKATDDGARDPRARRLGRCRTARRRSTRRGRGTHDSGRHRLHGRRRRACTPRRPNRVHPRRNVRPR